MSPPKTPTAPADAESRPSLGGPNQSRRLTRPPYWPEYTLLAASFVVTTAMLMMLLGAQYSLPLLLAGTILFLAAFPVSLAAFAVLTWQLAGWFLLSLVRRLLKSLRNLDGSKPRIKTIDPCELPNGSRAQENSTWESVMKAIIPVASILTVAAIGCNIAEQEFVSVIGEQTGSCWHDGRKVTHVIGENEVKYDLIGVRTDTLFPDLPLDSWLCGIRRPAEPAVGDINVGGMFAIVEFYIPDQNGEPTDNTAQVVLFTQTTFIFGARDLTWE